MVSFLKHSCVYAALIVASGSALLGQDPPTPAPKPATIPDATRAAGTSSTSSSVDTTKTYVRRFSFGASLSYIALDTMHTGAFSKVTTTPPFDGVYRTTPTKHPMGYGAQAQLAISNHFAVAAGLFMHRIAYIANGDIYTGTDNPLTITDDRKHTVTNEDTRARFYDLPVTVRYYKKSRRVPGVRWFAEGGMAVRHVSNTKTSIDTTVGSGDTSCCVTTPSLPKNQNTKGGVAGFGIHLVDGIGIRVIPQVRYTYWFQETYNFQSTISKKNQIEAMVTIGF